MVCSFRSDPKKKLIHSWTLESKRARMGATPCSIPPRLTATAKCPGLVLRTRPWRLLTQLVWTAVQTGLSVINQWGKRGYPVAVSTRRPSWRQGQTVMKAKEDKRVWSSGQDRMSLKNALGCTPGSLHTSGTEGTMVPVQGDLGAPSTRGSILR